MSKKRFISIFDGIKMIGCRDYEGQCWKVIENCSYCGQCCEDRGPEWRFAADDICGGCKYLTDNNRCGLGAERPFSCSINSPSSPKKYCSVKFKKVKNLDEIIG
jgi:hypothetical protein